MKPHKHCELIKAWADGAEIQWKDADGRWHSVDNAYAIPWNTYIEYRIKPEPKHDVVEFYQVRSSGCILITHKDAQLKLTFDGETGELKSAEVMK